jgi:hypothetical protein
MGEIKQCLCGSLPVVEKDTGELNIPIEKFHCPVCANKELPFLDARDSMREWNRIAPDRDYHKRTLEYNIHGVCTDKPYKIFEWRDRTKKLQHVTIPFYFDNGMYYYCYDYWYKNSGSGRGLWISDSGFPSMAQAKKHAAQELLKFKEITGIVKEVLFTPVQPDMFDLVQSDMRQQTSRRQQSKSSKNIDDSWGLGR